MLIELALRPGKYAVARALPLIRFLTASGAILMAIGLAVLIDALIHVSWGR